MIRDRTDKMLERATEKLMNGIESAMARHADVLRYLVAIPVGPDGRSLPGEYPRRETGQLQDNVAWGVSMDRLEGRVGVKGRSTDEVNLHRWSKENIGGLALHWLENSRGRRGIISSWHLRDWMIAREIIEGAEG